MQHALKSSSHPCWRRGHGVQRSRLLAAVHLRSFSELRLQDQVTGKPSSATGNLGPAAQPKRQRPHASPSSAASGALPDGDSDRRTPQAGPLSGSERLHSSSRQQASSRPPAGSPSNADPAGKADGAAVDSGQLQRPRPPPLRRSAAGSSASLPRQPTVETSLSSAPHMQDQPSQLDQMSHSGQAGTLSGSEHLHNSSGQQPSGRQPAGSPSSAHPGGKAPGAPTASGELQRPHPPPPRRPAAGSSALPPSRSAAETNESTTPHMQHQPSQPDPVSRGGQAGRVSGSERLHSGSSRQQPSSKQPAGSPSDADPAGKANDGATVEGKIQVPRRLAVGSSRSSAHVPVHKEDELNQSRQTRRDHQASKTLTSTISACSSLDMLRQLLGPHLQQGEMDEYNINAAWGRLAKLTTKAGGQDAAAHHVPQLRDQLANITLAKLQGMDTRGAANIVHALGTLQLRPANGLLTQLLGRLMAGDGAMLRQAEPQQLSNMAWALSRLVPLQQDEQMGLMRIAEETVSRLRHHGAVAFAVFKPQHISNLALAYATAGMSAAAGDGTALLLEDLFNELATAVLTQLPDFNSQDCANTAWAYAKVGHRHQGLMAGIMQAATPCLGMFKPQGLANLLWAIATLDCTPKPGFMPAWAQAANQAADRFNSQEIANSLWALSRLRIYDRDLISSLLHHAELKLSTFNAQNLANSLLALATLRHRDEAAVAALAAAAQGRLHQFSTQELANTLWALASLNFTHNTTTVEKLLQQLAAQDVSKLTVEGCVNVWQAWCWLGSVRGGQGRLQDRLEVLRMVDQCEQRAKARMASSNNPSRAQQEVAAMLHAMLAVRAAGLEVAQEQQHPVTQQMVDIVLLRPGGAWAAAVEVDGESHHAVNKPGHLLGGTVLRNRLLQAQGLPVVTIPFYDWNQQQGKEALKQYLHTKLDALLAKPSGS